MTALFSSDFALFWLIALLFLVQALWLNRRKRKDRLEREQERLDMEKTLQEGEQRMREIMLEYDENRKALFDSLGRVAKDIEKLDEEDLNDSERGQ